jgi:hypothetical protein
MLKVRARSSKKILNFPIPYPSIHAFKRMPTKTLYITIYYFLKLTKKIGHVKAISRERGPRLASVFSLEAATFFPIKSVPAF